MPRTHACSRVTANCEEVVEKDKAIDTLVNSIVNAVELQLIENESLNIADRRRC